MRPYTVHADTEHLDIVLLERVVVVAEREALCGATGRIVLWVEEENEPLASKVTQRTMLATLVGNPLKVRCCITNLQGLVILGLR